MILVMKKKKKMVTKKYKRIKDLARVKISFCGLKIMCKA